MIFFSNKARPYHFGPYPLERIARDASVLDHESAQPRLARQSSAEPGGTAYADVLEKYHQLFHGLRDKEPAGSRAPVPVELERRAVDIKGSGYFLNASQVGICELSGSCWLKGSTPLDHSHAIVVLVEHPRTPEDGSLANSWVKGAIGATAALRA